MPVAAPLSHEPPYLHGLNPVQREAVEAMDGPVLVLAGAGTGKTRVLTTRLAHIVNTRRAFPSQILAVTFTNKAAAEMRHRVAHALGAPAEGWWLGTFHALAARMLRRHAELVGPDQQLHHHRSGRPGAAVQGADGGGGDRHQEMDAARLHRPDRPLEGQGDDAGRRGRGGPERFLPAA